MTEWLSEVTQFLVILSAFCVSEIHLSTSSHLLSKKTQNFTYFSHVNRRQDSVNSPQKLSQKTTIFLMKFRESDEE